MKLSKHYKIRSKSMKNYIWKDLFSLVITLMTLVITMSVVIWFFDLDKDAPVVVEENVFTENMQDCIDKDGEYSLKIEHGEVRWEHCKWSDEINYKALQDNK